jgi:hypothetical protein
MCHGVCQDDHAAAEQERCRDIDAEIDFFADVNPFDDSGKDNGNGDRLDGDREDRRDEDMRFSVSQDDEQGHDPQKERLEGKEPDIENEAAARYDEKCRHQDRRGEYVDEKADRLEVGGVHSYAPTMK